MNRNWTALAAVALLVVPAACGKRRAPAPVVPAIAAPAARDTALPRAVPETTAVAPVAPVKVPPDTTLRPPTPRRPERPAQRCSLDFENTPETRLLSVKDPTSQKYTTYIGGGVVGVCRDQGIRILGDSAESYDQNRLHFLIGHVKYREDRVSLDADRLTYFQAEERLLAEGNVVVTMKDSSSMTGPRAEYLRAVRGIRTTSRLNATGRPTLRMYETDSSGRRQGDPVTLVADNISGEGESIFVAQGTVRLDRTDLQARGDSAVLDNARQFSRLMKDPFVESKGSQPFTLDGRVIDVFGRTRRVDRVLAMDSAKAVNKDLTLTADTIDLRVHDNKLQHAFAFGTGRAVAVTPERRILAESLDVRMPDQRIRELHAVGDAYAESDPDTLKVKSAERDWLRGDTIVAHFDSVATDTARQPAIIDLVAVGKARSYYQVASNKGEKERPGVNYVRGRRITLDFKARDVDAVTVEDSVSGVYLEAVEVDTLAARQDRSRRPQRRPPATASPVRPRRPPSTASGHD